MREINKDLKQHFKKLEEKVSQLTNKQQTLEGKENKQFTSVPIFSEVQELIAEYRQKQTYDNLLTNMTRVPEQKEKKKHVTINESRQDVYECVL